MSSSFFCKTKSANERTLALVVCSEQQPRMQLTTQIHLPDHLLNRNMAPKDEKKMEIAWDTFHAILGDCNINDM